jgi:N-succinyldiaminopimelate aminotransferase
MRLRVVNSRLSFLQPYPFEKLRDLVAGVTPAALPPIRLSIGEPQHPTPQFIRDAVIANLDGLSVYPTTAGSDRLREALAAWFRRRYRLRALDAATEVIPVNGSREALFALAQAVIDPAAPSPLVVCPNPFYQIYEGAAILAGASTAYLNQTPENGFGLDLDALGPAEWSRTQLLFVCSPANPTGRVLTLEEWRALFDLSDRYGFVIASDECYSEIYFHEDAPALGGLEAAALLGRHDFKNLVVFTSLSKRSNVPGMRTGGVAGDRSILCEFLRYRTYHGSAMGPTVQEASIAAWQDEAHVVENRRLYRAKFEAVIPMLAGVMDVRWPDAAFYLWAGTHGPDDAFSRDLLAAANVAVLPGRYLGREVRGINPGAGFVRIALVAGLDECVEAAGRIVEFCRNR